MAHTFFSYSFTYCSLAQLLALDLASNCEIIIQQVISPSFSFDHHDFNLRQRSPSKKSSNLIRLRPPIAVYVSSK